MRQQWAWSLSSILLTACAGTGGQAPIPPEPPRKVAGYDHVSESPRLRFAWNEGAISGEGLEFLTRVGERHVARLRERLRDVPDHRITVILEGPAERPDGSWGRPHVDGLGRVHLYRYGPTHHDYQGAFAHELVHAMRIGRMPHHDWFFEEGLAEFLALRVDDDLRGFPWYGYPVDLVAGQWLDSGAAIPLATLRRDHRRVNGPCRAQAYALRSAFFDWLGRAHGDGPVLEMAHRARAGKLEDYSAIFGEPFEDLAADWHAALEESFREMENAAERARAYRKETPIQYMPVCDETGEVRR